MRLHHATKGKRTEINEKEEPLMSCSAAAVAHYGEADDAAKGPPLEITESGAGSSNGIPPNGCSSTRPPQGPPALQPDPREVTDEALEDAIEIG
eukprot:15761949-Heterocapsa_arctica.AAC.1